MKDVIIVVVFNLVVWTVIILGIANGERKYEQGYIDGMRYCRDSLLNVNDSLLQFQDSLIYSRKIFPNNAGYEADLKEMKGRK